jgi:hypothetical protein
MANGKTRLLTDFVAQQAETSAVKKTGNLQSTKAVKQQDNKPAKQQADKAAGYVRATFYVDRQPFKRFKLKAVELDRDYSDCLREAIDDWLKRH